LSKKTKADTMKLCSAAMDAGDIEPLRSLAGASGGRARRIGSIGSIGSNPAVNDV
jgi:hypothetical protein